MTEETQREFFERSAELYGRAAKARGEIVRTFRVADLRVRLRFAGAALVDQVVPALAHLHEEGEGERDLEVRLWDSASTGVEMAPPPCNRRNFTNRGDIWGFDSRRYLSAFHYGDFSVNLMDAENHDAVYWVRDAARLPFWVNASPLRSILHWRLAKAGMQLVHAAVIGTDDGAVVIPGRGGSGKSTTALLSVRHGLRYLSDDYAAVRLDPEHVHRHAARELLGSNRALRRRERTLALAGQLALTEARPGVGLHDQPVALVRGTELGRIGTDRGAHAIHAPESHGRGREEGQPRRTRRRDPRAGLSSALGLPGGHRCALL